jgi:DNA-binding NarL/FixJ family response regulator
MNSRVLVVESHPITRWGLARLLEDQDDLTVVGATGSPDEAVSLSATLLPDVVTIGLGRPDGHGLPLARHLRDRFDDLGLVVLAAAEDDEVLLQAFETGVSAFVSKNASVAEVLGAVRHASVSASSFTASGLAAALRRRRDAGSSLDLSPRERQVLDLLVDGRSVPALAASLHISPSTAKTYVARLYEKLGARNRAEAVMAAVRLGLTAQAEPAPLVSYPPLASVTGSRDLAW